MIKEKYGKATAKKIYLYDKFKGVDYAHAPANIDPGRSVNGLNMVRSEIGKVCKRTGFEYDAHQWQGNVNGVHFLQLGDESICLVHCGTAFYVDNNAIYTGAADRISSAVQMKDKLYILDGKKFLMFDGTSVQPVKDSAYIPVTYINRTPEGGGKVWQQPNILTSLRREGFVADGENKVFVLSQPALGPGAVTAQIYSDDGTVTQYTEGSGISVDRQKGIVTFSSAPPLPKVTSQDNVYITYEKSAGDSLPLDKCTVITAFGPGGRPDTLFLSGNPDYPGREWFSHSDNPQFFGESNTDLAGSDNAPVVGYSTKGDKLFVHRRHNQGNMNIIVRSCSGGDVNYYSYPVINSLQGPVAVNSATHINMANDSLFLTQSGVYAVVRSEATADHYTQLRSFFINPSLLDGKSLAEATAVAYNDFYVLAVGRDIYLLDTLQKSFVEDKGYSGWQFECYHWQISESIRLLFVQDGRLCFVTDSGRTGRFYTDYNNPNCFNDDGMPITALWQTGDFTAGFSSKNKSIHRLWVVCSTALRTAVVVQAQIKGIWQQIFSDMTTARFFQWSAIQWSKFTWSTDKTPKLMKSNVKIKNVNKIAFRLENSNLNEPFGIYELGFEYTTGSDYR